MLFRGVFLIVALGVLGAASYAGWTGVGAANISAANASQPSLRSGSPRAPGYIGRIK